MATKRVSYPSTSYDNYGMPKRGRRLLWGEVEWNIDGVEECSAVM